MHISSGYVAHEKPVPLVELQTLMNNLEKKKGTLLIGCDSNASHTLWGSSESNERGEYLFDFIINTNLLVCNRGNSPTFICPSTGN